MFEDGSEVVFHSQQIGLSVLMFYHHNTFRLLM